MMTKTLVAVKAGANAEHDFARRVRAEYAAMPGLCLTLPQAQRLWKVDRQTCEAVFSGLIADGFLRMTSEGQFVRR
jgi:hypothetical protein